MYHRVFQTSLWNDKYCKSKVITSIINKRQRIFCAELLMNLYLITISLKIMCSSWKKISFIGGLVFKVAANVWHLLLFLHYCALQLILIKLILDNSRFVILQIQQIFFTCFINYFILSNKIFMNYINMNKQF